MRIVYYASILDYIALIYVQCAYVQQTESASVIYVIQFYSLYHELCHLTYIAAGIQTSQMQISPL